MTSPRQAIFFSFLDRYSGLFVSIATSMVLARLLTPEEIGVFSITMVLLGIVSTIRDAGASQYVVREPNLTEEGVRATRTIQLGIGLGLCLLTLALAKPVAAFYNTAEIENIMWVLAANFMIIPLVSVMVAIWTRELKFYKIALLRFIGGVVGSAVGISLALYDYGVISLAWSAVATQLTSVFVAYFLWEGQYSLIPGFRELRRVFSFGSKLTVYSIITSFGVGAPEMVLGRIQGMLQTGLLSRGQGLVSMFDRLVSDAIGAVVFPLFSQTMRDGGDLGATYLRAIGMLTAAGWSFLAVLAISAFPVVRILYGDQWDGAVTITRILCLVLALSIPARLAGTVLIIQGSLSLSVKLALGTTTITITSCVIGAFFGLNGLGWALVGAAFINLLIWLSALYSVLNYSLKKLAQLALYNFILALVAAFPFAVVGNAIGFTGDIGDLVYLLPAGIISVLIFTLIAKRMNHPLHGEIDIAITSLKRISYRLLGREKF